MADLCWSSNYIQESRALERLLIYCFIYCIKIYIFNSNFSDIECSGKDAQQYIEIIELDTTKDDSVRTAVQHVLKKEGRIDVIVNNAGLGYIGTI